MRLKQEMHKFLGQSSNIGLLSRFSNPFISMHVRYGDKYLEAAPIPLEKYFDVLTHFQNVSKNVFLSTETQSVIGKVEKAKLNVSYVWHYLNYSRLGEIFIQGFPFHLIELIRQQTETSHDKEDRQKDMIPSFVNLFIAIQADGFIGIIFFQNSLHFNQKSRSLTLQIHRNHIIQLVSPYQ